MNRFQAACGFAQVCAISALVAGLGASNAHADSLKQTTGPALTRSEQLKFGGNAEGSGAVGAFTVQQYTGANGSGSTVGSSFLVYCLDPFNYQSSATSIGTSSLFDYLNGGTYANQFTQGSTSSTSFGNYTAAATGGTPYKAQNTTTVLNKLVDLYAHAYADSVLGSAFRIGNGGKRIIAFIVGTGNLRPQSQGFL